MSHSTQKAFRIALVSYIAWGFFPIYWRFLHAVPAVETLAHRMLWSAVFYAFLFAALQGRSGLRVLLRQSAQHWLASATCALLIAINWGVYVYAVNSGQILQGSLAYFINPLLNVFVGVLFFKESFPTPLKIAVAFATAGIMVQAFGSPTFPTIALTLAVTFCIYGVVKKMLQIPANISSVMEGISSLPFALGAAIYFSTARPVPLSTQELLLLVGGGFITGLPLYMFSIAAQKLPYSVMGVMQFIAPSLQFCVGLFIFGEKLDTSQVMAFILIWVGIGIYLTFNKAPKTKETLV